MRTFLIILISGLLQTATPTSTRMMLTKPNGILR